jgi:hypothetical protein
LSHEKLIYETNSPPTGFKFIAEQVMFASVTEPILLRATVLIGAIEAVQYLVIEDLMPVSCPCAFLQSWISDIR